MGLFNKKPMTADDVFKLIKELPEDEFNKLSDKLLADEDDNGKPDTIEEVEEAKEDIEAKGEDAQTEEDRIDESVAEQEKDEVDEDSQDADDRVDEAEGEEKTLEEKDTEEEIVEYNKDEVIEALTARVTELEEKLSKVVESIDGNASFGNHSPELIEGKGGDDEDSRIMRNYMRKQTYRK